MGADLPPTAAPGTSVQSRALGLTAKAQLSRFNYNGKAIALKLVEGFGRDLARNAETIRGLPDGHPTR
ncbi:MAG: hypothetical protein AAF667_17540 [Pseudomonadota bacterium]